MREDVNGISGGYPSDTNDLSFLHTDETDKPFRLPISPA